MIQDTALKGGTAIITGASKGIGKGIAEVFAQAGIDLCIVARTAHDLEPVAVEMRGLGVKCVPVAADITKSADVNRMVETAIRDLGHVDFLINNAGMEIVKPIVPTPEFKPPTERNAPDFGREMADDEWDRVVNTNLKGPFLCIRAVGPHMIQRRKGKIINVSSINEFKAGPYRVTYAASKSGLHMLTRSMAFEWARYKINVNAIAPGWVETEITKNFLSDETIRKRALAEIPFRRVASPQEIGYAALYLASPASDYITGHTIVIDGGLTL